MDDSSGKAEAILQRFAALSTMPGTALAKRHLSASYLAGALVAELGHHGAARTLAGEVERYQGALELVLAAERRSREPQPEPGVGGGG
jgi:hypothetical protein